ncbi:MAG: hypothetical protein QM773_13455 [Hyphomonadaceae bacterium]
MSAVVIALCLGLLQTVGVYAVVPTRCHPRVSDATATVRDHDQPRAVFGSMSLRSGERIAVFNPSPQIEFLLLPLEGEPIRDLQKWPTHVDFLPGPQVENGIPSLTNIRKIKILGQFCIPKFISKICPDALSRGLSRILPNGLKVDLARRILDVINFNEGQVSAQLALGGILRILDWPP